MAYSEAFCDHLIGRGDACLSQPDHFIKHTSLARCYVSIFQQVLEADGGVLAVLRSGDGIFRVMFNEVISCFVAVLTVPAFVNGYEALLLVGHRDEFLVYGRSDVCREWSAIFGVESMKAIKSDSHSYVCQFFC